MTTVTINLDLAPVGELAIGIIPTLCTALVLLWCVREGYRWWLGDVVKAEVVRLSDLRAIDPSAPLELDGRARKYNARERIANRVADAARLHFGAGMEDNRANYLVVQRWLRDHLLDHYGNVTVRDKNTIASLALTLFFLPTPFDVEMAQVRRHREYSRRVHVGVFPQ